MQRPAFLSSCLPFGLLVAAAATAMPPPAVRYPESFQSPSRATGPVSVLPTVHVRAPALAPESLPRVHVIGSRDGTRIAHVEPDRRQRAHARAPRTSR